MALYFAKVLMQNTIGTLYDSLVAHYAQVPQGSLIPPILPPIPNNVAWLRIVADNDLAGTYILGTSSTAANHYEPVQSLSQTVEFMGSPNRNIIDLKGIFIEVPAAGTAMLVTFQVF